MARIAFVLALSALVLAIVSLLHGPSVTSVGLALPSSAFNVGNSPVTSSGTLTGTFIDQKANTLLAGPAVGSPAVPAFRPLGFSDFPAGLSYVQASGAKCDGTTNDTAAFHQADASSKGAITVPPGVCVIGTSVTLAHQLVMSPGAMLSIAQGVTLTILAAPMASPQQQIFTGGGAVSIPSNVQTIYPEWWGAKADRSTDSAPAIQAAVKALPNGGTVQFGSGFYKMDCASTHAVTVSAPLVNLYGNGNQLTRLMPKTNCPNFLFNINAGHSGNVRDLFFDGEDIGAPFASHTWGAILCSRCGGNDFSNLQGYGSATFMKFDFLMDAVLRNIQVQGCTIACYIFGNGPLDQAGAQHVTLVNIDYVTAFALGTRAAFTGSITGTTLIVSAVSLASLQVGQTINWGTTASAKIVGLGTATGGTGTYVLDTPQTVASTAMHAAAGIGMIFDSGTSEIAIHRYLNGGMVGGVLIQNSAAATGGHRPEDIRFFSGTNLSGNMNYGMSVQSAWVVENYGTSVNGTAGGPGIILGPPSGPATVDRFSLIGGESLANAQDNVLIQAACNVAIRSALSIGGGRQTINKYSAVHATAAACGALEITGNTMGGGVYGNIQNGQAFAVQLDAGSYATQTVGRITFTGRINIQMNLVQGNQRGGINNAGAVPTGANLLIANQL